MQATGAPAADAQAPEPQLPSTDNALGEQGQGDSGRREGVQAENGDVVRGTGKRRRRRPKGRGQQ